MDAPTKAEPATDTAWLESATNPFSGARPIPLSPEETQKYTAVRSAGLVRQARTLVFDARCRQAREFGFEEMNHEQAVTALGRGNVVPFSERRHWGVTHYEWEYNHFSGIHSFHDHPEGFPTPFQDTVGESWEVIAAQAFRNPGPRTGRGGLVVQGGYTITEPTIYRVRKPGLRAFLSLKDDKIAVGNVGDLVGRMPYGVALRMEELRTAGMFNAFEVVAPVELFDVPHTPPEPQPQVMDPVILGVVWANPVRSHENGPSSISNREEVLRFKVAQW